MMSPLSNPILQRLDALNRRTFLRRSAAGIGVAALASLLNESPLRASVSSNPGGLPGLPHFAAKAKRVIYLFQSGAPSQMDLFDYKPQLEKYRAQELPESIRQGQRLTTMTSGQKAFPVAPSLFKFQKHGR